MSKALVTDNETLLKFIKFLDTYNGRDKIARFLQYSGRFLAWYLPTVNNQETAKKAAILENHCSLARKLFRLFRFVHFFHNAQKTLLEEPDLVIKGTTVVQSVCLGLWLVYDHIIWAAKLNLTKVETTTYARRANIFWLIAMIMGVVKSAYLFKEVSESKNSPQVIRISQFSYALEGVRNVLDMPIPLYGLSTQFASRVPTGVVGLLGAITSLIGCYQQWNKIR